jgi:hypothetical protein
VARAARAVAAADRGMALGRACNGSCCRPLRLDDRRGVGAVGGALRDDRRAPVPGADAEPTRRRNRLLE